MNDYPAAHSMDTEWFSVDFEGHIGLFHSGEDGGVPKSAEPGLEFFLSIHEFFQQPIPIAGKNEIAALLSEASFSLEQAAEEGGKDSQLEHCLLLMSSQDTLEDLLEELEEEGEGEVFRVDVAEPVVYADLMDPERLGELLDEGACLKFRYLGVEGGEPIAPSRLGMFGYESFSVDDAWPTLKYERTHVPDKPLRKEDMPETVKGLIGNRMFKQASFSTSEYLDIARDLDEPLAMWADFCAHFDEETEMVRAVPGYEKQYASRHHELKKSYGDEYTFEEPKAPPT